MWASDAYGPVSEQGLPLSRRGESAYDDGLITAPYTHLNACFIALSWPSRGDYGVGDGSPYLVRALSAERTPDSTSSSTLAASRWPGSP